MHEERISGLIFAPTRTTVGRLERLTLDFRRYWWTAPPASGSIDSVVLDNPAAMGALVEHLVERGYRRIAALFGSTAPRRPSAATAILCDAHARIGAGLP